MPVRARRVVRRRRPIRRVVRKAPYRRRTFRRTRAMPMFPSSRIIRTKCTGELTNYAPAAVTGALDWYANSFFDPMNALGNADPQYYTEIKQVYGKYKVLSSYFRVHIFNTTGDMVECAICTYSTGRTPTSFREAAQRQGGIYRVCGATDEQMKNSVIMKHSWSLKKSAPKGTSNAEAYSALMDAVPTNAWHGGIFFKSANNIIINYRAELFMTVLVYDKEQNSPDIN